VADTGIEERARTVPAGPEANTPTMEHPLVTPRTGPAPDRALQILAHAQQLATDRVAAAVRRADRVHQDARAAAQQVAREAQTHAENRRREADSALAEARAEEHRVAEDARRRTGEARRQAEQVLAGARTRATRVAEDARRHAEAMSGKAERRYEDSVGILHARRDELRQRARTLAQFDGDYRARVAAFIEARLADLGAGPDRMPPAEPVRSRTGDR